MTQSLSIINSLTNKELDDKIAEFIMCWTVDKINSGEGVTHWKGQPNINWYTASSSIDPSYGSYWNPTQNHSQAYEMEELAHGNLQILYAFYLACVANDFSAADYSKLVFWVDMRYKRIDENLFNLLHATPRQRCVAAIMAYQSTKDSQ